MDGFKHLLLRRPAKQVEDCHLFQAGERAVSEGGEPSPFMSGNISPPPSSVASASPSRSQSHTRSHSNLDDRNDLASRSRSGRKHSCSPIPSGSKHRRQGTPPLNEGQDSVIEKGKSLGKGGSDTARTYPCPSPDPTQTEVQRPPRATTSSFKYPKTSKLRKTRLKTIFKIPHSKPSTSGKPKFAWKRLNPALVLENSGSVARDHLASERTFLAYVRTSLALASTGVALVQLFTIADLTARAANATPPDASRRIQRFARPLGMTSILLALIVLGIAAYRYFLVQHALPEQKFPVARLSIAFISFVLGAVVVVIFGALVGGRE